ncbi:radical SAM protein [Streptomyces sp. NPDC006173]|uniref:B12-binding domain-containing radical SAM protein n=1 Tax=Streptomyces sp. NPDC006173 TaxID=3155349 RepID=UPI0033C362BD
MRPLALISGADPNRSLDALFINAPLRDYSLRPRTNDYTLPVLGMAYIATYAQRAGFNVGVLDAEAHGLGIKETAQIVNDVIPRWAAMNLLAPTYEMSARIAEHLAPEIALMVGGHHAKAMPNRILNDPRMRNLRALVLGEGELRVAALLEDEQRRRELPGVIWRDPLLGTRATGIADAKTSARMLGPDINTLPYVNRAFMPQDPYQAAPTATDRRIASARGRDWLTAAARTGHAEANIVGSRGCPYNCTFCGAAWSANPDVKIRVRSPRNIIGELDQLHDEYGVTCFRFVDDLFLGVRDVIHEHMKVFADEEVGARYVWDATGRINVLDRLSDSDLDVLVGNGLREVALGIESGSDTILKAMDKRINAAMTERVTRRLLTHGIDVKGYLIWSGRYQPDPGYGSPKEQDGYDDFTDAIPVLFTTLDRLQASGPHAAVWWRWGHRQWETLPDALDNPADRRAWEVREKVRRARYDEELAQREREWAVEKERWAWKGPSRTPCRRWRCVSGAGGRSPARWGRTTRSSPPPEDGRHCSTCRSDMRQYPTLSSTLFGRRPRSK